MKKKSKRKINPMKKITNNHPLRAKQREIHAKEVKWSKKLRIKSQTKWRQN